MPGGWRFVDRYALNAVYGALEVLVREKMAAIKCLKSSLIFVESLVA
jgi:hypothetical protein